MQADRHYMSDVIAGATVGLLAGRSVTVGHGSSRFTLRPTAMPGGIGISIGRDSRN
jgi:membrane-associated phospholipid phosphatase